MMEASPLAAPSTHRQRIIVKRTPMYAYRTKAGQRLLTLGDEAKRQTLRRMSYREFRRARRGLKYTNKRYKKASALAHTYAA